MNKLLGMIGTTLGGGLIGAGVQRYAFAINSFGGKVTKMISKNPVKIDETTWILLITGLVVLACGVYFTRKS